jgi:Uma2 family endonuclease
LAGIDGRREWQLLVLQSPLQRDTFVSMNRHLRDMTTTAAEGLPRRRFTVAELERMTEAGILEEDERIELIGGEIVPMSPKGNHHELLKMALTHYWSPKLPADLTFATETTFRLTADTYLEPDFVFFPSSSSIPGLTAATAKLVVELADSSLGYDLGRKAALYAGFGIAELWVIDAVKLVAHIHRDPQAEGYRSVVALGRDARLVPQALPDLAVTLGELKPLGALRP